MWWVSISSLYLFFLVSSWMCNSFCFVYFDTTIYQVTADHCEEWIKKMCYTWTVEYHSVIKMNKTAICRDMNGPRVCPTEWSESEREKQTSYNIAWRGNLEKWYRWTYLNLVSDVKTNVWLPSWGGGWWNELEEWDRHIYITLYTT